MSLIGNPSGAPLVYHFDPSVLNQVESTDDFLNLVGVGVLVGAGVFVGVLVCVGVLVDVGVLDGVFSLCWCLS